MNFKPFLMAELNAQLRSQSNTADELINLHSSNPEPFSWDELTDLVGVDLISSLRQTKLGYESTQGDSKLRTIISQQYHQNISAEQLLLTSGAQEGIFVVMNALLKSGDQVISFTPCFEPLAQVAEHIGAEVTLLPLDADNAWQINWQQLEDSINHNTQLVVINFPHNPTGSHISLNDLERLIQLCKKNDCWLLSDEVFRGLEHNLNDRIPSAADCYDKAIAIGVVSKSLALPGIRLGWVALQNNELLQNILTIKSHLSICQSALDTYICQQIIPYSELIWERNRAIILENKKWISHQLTDHPTLQWQPAVAAATGFIQLKQDASQHSLRWAEKFNISVMPNEVFLTANAGFRLTLGTRQAQKHYQQIIHDDGLF